jgi:hypothetical protein
MVSSPAVDCRLVLPDIPSPNRHDQHMTKLELTRSPDDRRLYVLGDIGSLRFEGLFSRAAGAEAGGRSWRFVRRGVFTARAEATDAAGTAVGQFEPRGLRRGGTVRWRDRSFALRPASAWRERYALVDGERELAVFDGKGWGRRPVDVELADASGLDAALVLFAAFVVRGLADDASGTAGAAASTAATTG